MLVVQPVGSGAARYYFGEHQPPGTWWGAGADGLGLYGEVARADLTAALRGRDPASGRYLPTRKSARRRAGWDLIFAAPKSLSLVAALAPEVAPAARASHDAAVREVFDHLEGEVLSVRRAGSRTPVRGALGAAFDHPDNAAREPHLHTHLILVNLAFSGTTWSPVADGWWPERRSLGALYQLSLRHHLDAAGWRFAWRLHSDGLADLAGVPRQALRATSSRTLAIGADAAGFAPADGRPAGGVRSGATRRSRNEVVPNAWYEHSVAAGFGTGEARRLCVDARGSTHDHVDASGPLETRVTGWLAGRRSSFRRCDVVVALAACDPRGLSTRDALAWVDRFCGQAVEAPAPGHASPRWTTPLARRADDHILALAAGAGAPHHSVDPADVHPPADRALLDSDRPVEVLAAPPGRSNLLAHAAVLGAAAAAWEAEGATVAVVTPGALAATRWETLAGVQTTRRHRCAADVVVVDQADRLPAMALSGVTSEALGRGARVVLLEGGTAPRLSWRASDGFAELGDRIGRIDPGPPPRWSLTSGGPAAEIVARWWEATRAGDAPLMVGLGPAEVDGLNQAARALLTPAASGSFAPGDKVVALRRVSDARAGSVGTVVEVDPERGALRVAWVAADHCLVDALGRAEVAHLGHGYAATPTLAAAMDGPLMVLGPPEALGRDRSRVIHHAAARSGAALGRELRVGL